MTSIFEHLREDHQLIKRALVRLRSVEPGHDPTAPLHELLRRYTAHARAEEQIFYSYLIHIRGVQSRALRGLEEHLHLDTLLRESENLSREDPNWTTSVATLCEAIDRHLRDEESSLFTLARGALSEREARELGDRFVAERARIHRDLSDLEEEMTARTPVAR